MRLFQTPEALFDEAYRGLRHESAMDDFGVRVAQRRAVIVEPSLWFWTPAFRLTIDWLKRRVGKGTVLEVGCGLGFVLHTLRKEGFDAVGLDVAETAVRLNRQDGFQVWHGVLESMPASWVRPAAIVGFFMLHHLENPVGFLQEIRRRWPTTPLALAQYGPANRHPIRSTPPRTLTRWNAQSMLAALEHAGYSASVQDIPSTGVERGLFAPLRALLGKTLRLPLVYRMNRRVGRLVLPKLLRPLRVDRYVVLAFAEPR